MQHLRTEAGPMLSGHRDAVYAFCKAEAPNAFFSAGGDGQIVRWTLPNENGVRIGSMPSAVYSLVFRPQHNQLWAGTRFGGLYVLDLYNKKVFHQFDLEGDVFELALDEKNGLVTAACGGGHLYLLSTNEMRILQSQRPSREHAREVVFDGEKLLATGWSDNQIRIYDARNHNELYTFSGGENSVFSLSFSPFQSHLISGGRDAQLRVWDADRGFDMVKTIPAHWFTVNDIQWHPQKALFATGSRDKSVKIWNGYTYQLLKVIDRTKFENAHTHSVNKLLWLNEEGLLISAGDDRIIRTWHTDMAGEG